MRHFVKCHCLVLQSVFTLFCHFCTNSVVPLRAHFHESIEGFKILSTLFCISITRFANYEPYAIYTHSFYKGYTYLQGVKLQVRLLRELVLRLLRRKSRNKNINNKKQSENADTSTSVTFTCDRVFTSRSRLNILVLCLKYTRYDVCELQSPRCRYSFSFYSFDLDL